MLRLTDSDEEEARTSHLRRAPSWRRDWAFRTRAQSRVTLQVNLEAAGFRAFLVLVRRPPPVAAVDSPLESTERWDEGRYAKSESAVGISACSASASCSGKDSRTSSICSAVTDKVSSISSVICLTVCRRSPRQITVAPL